MFSFLQCVLVLEFVRKGLGGDAVWEGVLCRKALCGASTTLSQRDPSPSERGTCVTVADAHLNTETSSGEGCVWATPCKGSVHSQGNNEAAPLGFKQRLLFLGQGGG